MRQVENDVDELHSAFCANLLIFRKQAQLVLIVSPNICILQGICPKKYWTYWTAYCRTGQLCADC